MPSISSDSSVNELDLPEVEVLLATLNGERYLSEFLESLAQQQGVKIHLRVSDDGSTDKSLEIVESYSSKFASIRTLIGPQKGPSANFFFLMKHSHYDFVAIADQDDIWLPSHLIHSLKRLSLSADPLAMTFCQVAETSNPSSSEFRIWPKVTSPLELFGSFFENYARGCTIVMKKELVKLITDNSTDGAVMHDWWIYLVAKTCGSAIFSETCEITYRIHSENTIGRGPRIQSRLFSIFKTIRSNQWAPWKQLVQINQIFNQRMSVEAKNEISILIRLVDLSFSSKISAVFFSNRRFRKNLVSDFLVKTYLLIQTIP
jgi:glycosyltransferase involved in cell wall biosynthesis